MILIVAQVFRHFLTAVTDWLREQSPLTEEELQKLYINMDDFKVRSYFFIVLPLLHCLLSYTFSHFVSVIFDQPTGRKKENGNNTIEKSRSIGLLLQFAFVVA